MRQYTGALVGLGYDPTTSEALLPDHDSELVFDVDITEKDIVEVDFVLNYLFFFVFYLLICFIKLNIQLQQKRNEEHKKEIQLFYEQKGYNYRVYRTYNLT